MKISLRSSILGFSIALSLASLGCSGGSSSGNKDAAAGHDGAAGGDGAAGSDAAAGSSGSGGADAAAGNDGAAGSDAAAGNDGGAGSDAGAGHDGAAGADAAAGNDGAAGSDAAPHDGSTGDALDGGDGGTVASALETAELALTDTNLNLLTATHVDLADGDQTPVGWGPKTLPTQEQRDAATVLIRRIAALLPGSARNAANTGGYTATDVNVLNALLTLNASPDDLIAGTNLAPAAGTAWEAYKAGAVADKSAPAGLLYLHGVAAGSSDATFAAYIAANGTDPEGVVGLSTNVVKAALKHGLETQLKAF